MTLSVLSVLVPLVVALVASGGVLWTGRERKDSTIARASKDAVELVHGALEGAEVQITTLKERVATLEEESAGLRTDLSEVTAVGLECRARLTVLDAAIVKAGIVVDHSDEVRDEADDGRD